MRVYFVRHGLSVNNAARMHQGADVPLSKIGEGQAKKVGRRIKDLPIDTIYASPQERAKKTAEIINSFLNKEIKFVDDLREIKRPTEVEGKFHQDPTALAIMTGVRANFVNPDYRFSDEENFYDLKARAENIIKVLENESSEHVLIVSHGTFIRVLAALMIFEKQLTPELYEIFGEGVSTENTGVTIFEKEAGQKWKLISWNDHSHLW